MAVKVHWFQIEPNLKEYEYEFTGLSTDDKPQDERVALNSLFLELDTGDFYYLSQKASKGEQTEVVRIEEQTFITQGFSRDYGCRYARLTAVEPFADENIIVIYDGASYECQNQSLESGLGKYGAEIDDYIIDFTNCPFYLETSDESNTPSIYLTDEEEHTIEVKTIQGNPDTPAVWTKLGTSGGVSPQPSEVVLWEGTLTASNAYEGGSGYMSDESVEVSASFPNKITVVCNGVSYECSAYGFEGYTRYGAPWDNGLEGFDFSEYPFHVVNYADNEYGFIFANLGTYEIKILADGSEPEPSGEKLFDGNVTTVEDNDVFVYEFSPMVALNYSSIIVEFDGTRYTAQNYANGENWYAFGKEMGSPSDEYPFGLVFGNNGNQGLATQIYTESAGTYSLKIWANSEEGEMPVPVPPLG